MTSIELTAYPRFKGLTSTRAVHLFFTPTADEVAWARERTISAEAVFALVLDLKCFQKMARFCSGEEIPEVVVEHIRRCLGLGTDVEPGHGASRTAKLHRKHVRARQGVRYDQQRARAIAAEAIREAALVKNHPPDLINVALERLLEASLELPAFSTLDELATAIRAEVNAEMFERVVERMGEAGQRRMRGLLTATGVGSDGRSMFNRLKKPAQRASWSRFKAQVEYLEANLWPRDCQTCGRPLGHARRSVYVVDLIELAFASVHHRTCRKPAWSSSGVMPSGFGDAHLSWTGQTLFLPLTVGGQSEDRPFVLINPGLEQVGLSRRPEGTGWSVNTVEFFRRHGLCLPGEDLVIDRAVPGATARLVGTTITVGFDEHPASWSIGVAHDLAARIRELGGVMLGITTAVDPHDLDQVGQFTELMTSGNLVMGWVALQHVPSPQ